MTGIGLQKVYILYKEGAMEQGLCYDNSVWTDLEN